MWVVGVPLIIATDLFFLKESGMSTVRVAKDAVLNYQYDAVVCAQQLLLGNDFGYCYLPHTKRRFNEQEVGMLIPA